MTFSEWLLFAVWVGLIALTYRVSVKPSSRLSQEVAEAVRRSVPHRHERRRDKRSG